MIRLVAVAGDEKAAAIFSLIEKIGKDNVFCRFLKGDDLAKTDEIAVVSWSGNCPGKYFRTASHVLRGNVDSRLAKAKAFLGVKNFPPEKAVKEVLADMFFWPRLKKNRGNVVEKIAKRRSVYLGAW